MTMFEPQDHPNDFEYDGGPPVPQYDNAGYTLALQMGVEFDRIMDGFEGPFEAVRGFSAPPPGAVTNAGGAAGFFVSHAVNDAAIATNRLLAADQEVYWISEGVTASGRDWLAGTLWVPATAMSPRHGRGEGLGARPRLHRPGVYSVGRSAKAEPGHDGALGPLWRIHVLGLDALDVRAVRVPVRRGLPDDPE